MTKYRQLLIRQFVRSYKAWQFKAWLYMYRRELYFRRWNAKLWREAYERNIADSKE